jgi:hypothetical protein
LLQEAKKKRLRRAGAIFGWVSQKEKVEIQTEVVKIEVDPRQVKKRK